MEFEVKEINGSVVYVRKDKKVVAQREDFPGDESMRSKLNFGGLFSSCTHNCSTCHSNCGGSN